MAFCSFQPTFQDSIVLDIQVDTPLCAGQLARIKVMTTGGAMPMMYSSDGGLNFGLISVFDLLAGTYIIVVKDANGILQDTSITIHQPDPLQLMIGQDTFTVGAGKVINLLAFGTGGTPPLTYFWTPSEGLSCSSCPNPTVVAGMINSYTINLIDKNGCSRSLSIAIDITTDSKLFIPTSFSPNQDGFNDLFQVYGSGIGVLEVEQLQVWDRWGSLVWEYLHFTLNDPAIGWDGTWNGMMMDPGVFAYFLKVKFIDGSTQSYLGDFTLVR